MFLSLTKVKPSPLSQRFSSRKQTPKGEAFSTVVRCLRRTALPTSLLHDHGFPTVATLPLASLSMHPTAIICISADRTYARSAKGGQILLSNSGMRYRAKGVDGWTNENRSCSREKRNKKKLGRCPGNEGGQGRLWEILWAGEFSPGGCFGALGFFLERVWIWEICVKIVMIRAYVLIRWFWFNYI